MTLHENLLTGQLVRLTAEDAETAAKAFTRWQRNSDYLRLMDSDPARQFSYNANQNWIEKHLIQGQADEFWFMIRTLNDDRLIGDIGLGGVIWNHREAWVGIAIGERKDWGKGYGTDAMRVLLQYAFQELNLQRVTLNVFEYNRRAIRSYEKAGFSVEGRVRDFMRRDGQWYDIVYMGILRSEWEAQQATQTSRAAA